MFIELKHIKFLSMGRLRLIAEDDAIVDCATVGVDLAYKSAKDMLARGLPMDIRPKRQVPTLADIVAHHINSGFGLGERGYKALAL